MSFLNLIKQASQTENTPELQAFWVKKYQNLLDGGYFLLNSKTLELLAESETTRPATPFGDLILGNHLEDQEINETLLQENIEIAVRFLDALLEVIPFNKNSRQIVNQYRKIGLGIAGFTNYYNNLDREKSETEEIDYVGNLVSNNVYRSSESLSEEKGLCENWDNIKKILRDKPFEYWYETESGDIKSSTEMCQNFDQKSAEKSNFEIVPRRNSHLLLFPAVKEWQVWSDREMKLETSNGKPKNLNSETEKPFEKVENKLISNTLPDLGNAQNLQSQTQSQVQNQVQNSENTLTNSKNGNSQAGKLEASFENEKLANSENTNPFGENQNISNSNPSLNSETGNLEVQHSQKMENKPNNLDKFTNSTEATIISFPKNLKTLESLKQKNLESDSTSKAKNETEGQNKNQNLQTQNLEKLTNVENPYAESVENENSNQDSLNDDLINLETENLDSSNTFGENRQLQRKNLEKLESDLEKLENSQKIEIEKFVGFDIPDSAENSSQTSSQILENELNSKLKEIFQIDNENPKIQKDSKNQNPFPISQKTQNGSEIQIQNENENETQSGNENGSLDNFDKDLEIPKVENDQNMKNSNNHNFFEKTDEMDNNSENLASSQKEKLLVENYSSLNKNLETESEKLSLKLENLAKEKTENSEMETEKFGENGLEMEDSQNNSQNQFENQSAHQSTHLTDSETALQLGELVKIVNKNSPILGQIHQIIKIIPGEKPTFELSNAEFGEETENGENSNSQIWQESDLEAVDLHGLLGKINQNVFHRIDSKNVEIEKTEMAEKITKTQEENEHLKSEIIKAHDQTKILSRELENQKMENLAFNPKISNLANGLISNFDYSNDVNSENLSSQDNSKLTNLENENYKLISANEKLLENEKTLQNQIQELSKNLETEMVKNENLNKENSLKNAKISELEAEITKIGQNQKFVSNLDNFQNSQNMDVKLANLQHQNFSNFSNNLQNNSKPTHPLSKNFFQLSGKIISFMSKYSLQLQQLASTSGNFQLGDILITLQYDGGGVKLVSASGEKLSKELKHMVDTVLGIVNKALSFGVPAKELAIQMRLEPKDDGTETPLNQILTVVAAALEEAPEQIQQVQKDSLVKIEKADVEAFTKTIKADSMAFLKGQLAKLQNSKNDFKKEEKVEPKTENPSENPSENSDGNSDENPSENFRNSNNSNSELQNSELQNNQNEDLKDNSASSQGSQNEENNLANPENEEENPFTNSQKNIQNLTSQKDKEKTDKQEEKPRSFFGGFGGRN